MNHKLWFFYIAIVMLRTSPDWSALEKFALKPSETKNILAMLEGFSSALLGYGAMFLSLLFLWCLHFGSKTKAQDSEFNAQIWHDVIVRLLSLWYLELSFLKQIQISFKIFLLSFFLYMVRHNLIWHNKLMETPRKLYIFEHALSVWHQTKHMNMHDVL